MKKITKEDIQKIIREETVKLLKEGLPVGAASLKPGGPVNIFQTGTFNMDVVVNGRPESITGQLDADSLDVLMELGAIQSPVRAAPDDPMTSVGGPDPADKFSDDDLEAWSRGLDEGFMDKVKGAIGLGQTKKPKKLSAK